MELETHPLLSVIKGAPVVKRQRKTLKALHLPRRSLTWPRNFQFLLLHNITDLDCSRSFLIKINGSPGGRAEDARKSGYTGMK